MNGSLVTVSVELIAICITYIDIKRLIMFIVFSSDLPQPIFLSQDLLLWRYKNVCLVTYLFYVAKNTTLTFSLPLTSQKSPKEIQMLKHELWLLFMNSKMKNRNRNSVLAFGHCTSYAIQIINFQAKLGGVLKEHIRSAQYFTLNMEYKLILFHHTLRESQTVFVKHFLLAKTVI